MIGPLVTGILAAMAVFMLFFAIQRLLPHGDETEERLREYGLTEYVHSGKRPEETPPKERQRFAFVERLLHGYGIADKLANMLAKADVPLTAAEFVVVLLIAGILGYGLGSFRLNPVIGLGLGAIFASLPIFYLRFMQSRRRNAFINQLPDVLTLLVGSLRAGYGLSQAIELVAREVSPPSSKEFGRVMRAISLGLPLQRALDNMAQRIESDDLDLVVTAINVQYEMGGNLATVLDTISETIRERVRVLREVRTLTAQQRLTGTILALIPVGLAVLLAVMRPGYFDPFFEPGWPRIMPAAAVVMMMIGFFLIRKIVDIKV
ncbi:MAG: type II secretion system F family protein [Caldilineaceae bacterium]|nr:type II secretion system F family protein [Caldilineaceae bacterium]